jgi:hypothetical protein
LAPSATSAGAGEVLVAEGLSAAWADLSFLDSGLGSSATVVHFTHT